MCGLRTLTLRHYLCPTVVNIDSLFQCLLEETQCLTLLWYSVNNCCQRRNSCVYTRPQLFRIIAFQMSSLSKICQSSLSGCGLIDDLPHPRTPLKPLNNAVYYRCTSQMYLLHGIHRGKDNILFIVLKVVLSRKGISFF